MHETFDYCLAAANLGTRAKIITGDVCCRLICTSRQDDGRQDPAHNWGFDPADISGDKEASQEKVRSHLCLC